MTAWRIRVFTVPSGSDSLSSDFRIVEPFVIRQARAPSRCAAGSSCRALRRHSTCSADKSCKSWRVVPSGKSSATRASREGLRGASLFDQQTIDRTASGHHQHPRGNGTARRCRNGRPAPRPAQTPPARHLPRRPDSGGCAERARRRGEHSGRTAPPGRWGHPERCAQPPLDRQDARHWTLPPVIENREEDPHVFLRSPAHKRWPDVNVTSTPIRQAPPSVCPCGGILSIQLSVRSTAFCHPR